MTQVDHNGKPSGLANIEKILWNVDGISFIHLGAKDVVRHRIVADIVTAFDNYLP